MTLRPIWGELHVHTVLSPCAEVEMIPPFIVRRARELGLGLLAITDHNSAENVAAVQAAAEGSDLLVIPGMELQTREEAHILCLFDTLEQVLDWQGYVYARLPVLPNRPEVLGSQFVVDETGDFVRENERLLLTSADLSIEQAVEGVNQRGGLAIAAHVDRPSFSVLASLGFTPPGLALAALELAILSPGDRLAQWRERLAPWQLVSSGDAHRLSDMRASTVFTIEERSFSELRLAFRRERGRKVAIVP